MKKTFLQISAIVTGFIAMCSSASAVVLDPSFDADSYIFQRTNNATEDDMSIGEVHIEGSIYHFNFAVIQFDVADLSLVGDKTLDITVMQYSSAAGQGDVDKTPMGSATVHVVALDASYQDHYLTVGNGALWFETYVRGGAEIGTIEFVDQGTFSLDVTTIVNSWISGGKTNYGFALWSSEGGVDIYASESDFGPKLTAVPEPSTYALFAGIAVLLGAMIYRKRK